MALEYVLSGGRFKINPAWERRDEITPTGFHYANFYDERGVCVACYRASFLVEV